jgi:nitroimidazol reductase NimA-like FMN-containing flavoprotein (pyridoxamine 5'-phosphate oxidase superfamily)
LKKAFIVTDKKIIQNILHEAEFGTLALCSNNKPYSLPINFMELNEDIYFHGAKNGKKIDFIKQNSNASFSIVESYSILPSYFSTDDGSACPATHMFKSVIINGKIRFVDDYDEKVDALNALMKKLQREGNYIPLNDDMYKKAVNATTLFKLHSDVITCKVKFGQNFNKDRYERVCKYLKQRGTAKDIATLKLINEFRDE